MSAEPETRMARAFASSGNAEIAEELMLYVAVGDSFSAGTGCSSGEAWPDRLAAALRGPNPRLAFRNLAAEGATSSDVLDQLPEALQFEPDLITVVCGSNDVLRSTRPDLEGYERRLSQIFDRLRQANPDVRIATATSPERWDFLKLGPRTKARVERGIARLNVTTRSVAAACGAACLDVAVLPGLSDPANFAADGLHPSARGHGRAAMAFGSLLRGSFGIQIDAAGFEGRESYGS